MFGVVRAIERFQPAHGAAFATFARFWIRASLSASIRSLHRRSREDELDSCRDDELSSAEVDFERELDRKRLLRRAMGAYRSLPSRDQLIVGSRYGLEGRVGRTLKELAAELQVSGQRVSQIERRALQRLRACVRQDEQALAAGA